MNNRPPARPACARACANVTGSRFARAPGNFPETTDKTRKRSSSPRLRGSSLRSDPPATKSPCGGDGKLAAISAALRSSELSFARGGSESGCALPCPLGAAEAEDLGAGAAGARTDPLEADEAGPLGGETEGEGAATATAPRPPEESNSTTGKKERSDTRNARLLLVRATGACALTAACPPRSTRALRRRWQAWLRLLDCQRCRPHRHRARG